MTVVKHREGSRPNWDDPVPDHGQPESEQVFSFLGRLLSMTAGGGSIGALAGPEGLVLGAVVGAVVGIVTAALNGREHHTEPIQH